MTTTKPPRNATASAATSRPTSSSLGSARGPYASSRRINPYGQEDAGDAGYCPRLTPSASKLPDQPGPPRAERGPQSQLAAPSGGPGREEPADVGAGDEEEAEHRREAEPDAAARSAADDVIEQRHHPDIEVPVDGMGLSQACRDQAHLGSGIFETDACRQAAQHLELIAVADRCRPGPQRQNGQRPPESCVPGGQLERPRHDADHHVIPAVDRERPAEHAVGPGELVLPEPFAQHDDPLAAIEFLPRESPSDERRRAQQLEELRADQAFLRALRRVDPRKRDDAQKFGGRTSWTRTRRSVRANRAGWPSRAVPPVLRDEVRADRRQFARTRVGERPSTIAFSTLNIVTLVPMPSARMAVTETAKIRSRLSPRKPDARRG